MKGTPSKGSLSPLRRIFLGFVNGSIKLSYKTHSLALLLDLIDVNGWTVT